MSRKTLAATGLVRAPLAAVALLLTLCVGPALADSTGEPTAAPHAATTPVVVIVLDGLPRSSLLKADGAVDAVWYPNLAALAARSTRFTAATTVAVRIGDALPAILTGRLPGDERRLPIVEDHPDSLFSMLADEYVMNVVESESILRDDGRGRVAHAARIKALRNDRNTDLAEHAAFRRFVRGIAPAARQAAKRGQGSLHFVHVRLPRYPWHMSPTGVSYRPYRMYEIFADVWTDEPWWPEEAWRRHLLQLRFVDALLGELVAALAQAGIDDSAAVVLTSDYGTSFWPGESRRSLGATTHPEDVLHVPLWVKRPGQKSPRVETRPAQTIDVLPTIAAILGRTLDFTVDGCSLLDGQCPGLVDRRVVQVDEHGRRRLAALPVDLTDRTATLERRIALVGSGRSPDTVYAFGPHAAMVGRRAESLEIAAEPAGIAHLDRQWARSGRGARGPRVVMQIDLEQPSPPRTPHVAIVRDGVIETVVPAPRMRKGQRIAAAMIPVRPELAPDTDLRVYLVEGAAEAPRLLPLTIQTGKRARSGG